MTLIKELKTVRLCSPENYQAWKFYPEEYNEW